MKLTKQDLISSLSFQISIHYTGKLKENGEVFESNAGQDPFKFRLGNTINQNLLLPGYESLCPYLCYLLQVKEKLLRVGMLALKVGI